MTQASCINESPSFRCKDRRVAFELADNKMFDDVAWDEPVFGLRLDVSRRMTVT